MSAQDAQDLTKRARMFLRDEKFEDSIEVLKEALDLEGEYTAAHNLLGIAWSRLGNGKKALAAFRKGRSLDRENPVLHFNLGLALEIWGQPEKAPPRYRAAFRLHPGWLGAMNALGLNQFRQEDYAAANRTFSKVLKFDPANAEALNNKGVVLADQGRYKEAIRKYRAALEIDGGYVKAGLNLAQALAETENFAAALEELERLADLAPGDWEVRTRLAALYHKLERYDEATDQARAILDRDPDNIQALRIEGAIQGIQGNDEAAKNIFERITAMNHAGESGETYGRFMIESPDSRYWLDLVPPPAAVLPAAAEKPLHPGAAALAKAREARAAGKIPAQEGSPVEPATPPDTAASPAATDSQETTDLQETTDSQEATAPQETADPDSSLSPVETVPSGDLLGLLRYLMDLAGALPEPALDDFMRSQARLEMKHIIDTLEQSHG